jgi:hypothetical protein
MVTDYPAYYKDTDSKIVYAYVKGYIILNSMTPTLGATAVKVLPYRAQLEVRAVPYSPLNKSGFYILSLTEVTGQENVRVFDETKDRVWKERGLK